MKILTFSTLFPNEEEHGYGIFVETHLRPLATSRQVTQARGVARVILVPSAHPRFSNVVKTAAVRRAEVSPDLQLFRPTASPPDPVFTLLREGNPKGVADAVKAQGVSLGGER